MDRFHATSGGPWLTSHPTFNGLILVPVAPLPADKHAQEDAVLGSLLEQMVREGVAASLVETPDRIPANARRFPEVTCDGLIEVPESGAIWAVDVMSIAGEIALTKVPTMLEAGLRDDAAQSQIKVTISGRLPDTSEVNAVVATARKAMRRTTSGACEPCPGLQVEWKKAEDPSLVGVWMLGVWVDSASALSDQVAAAITRPLRKKATVQAKAGSLAGCATAVLLDQVGHASLMQGTQWLPEHPHTFRLAVEAALVGLMGNYLDAVLLHGTDGKWHALYGSFPGVPSESLAQ